MDWEKVFANDAIEKELIPQLSKQLRKQIMFIKNIQSKMGRRSKQIFLQRRCTDGQQAYEKMFNVMNYQRNANQKYNEIPPHTNQNGHH